MFKYFGENFFYQYANDNQLQLLDLIQLSHQELQSRRSCLTLLRRFSVWKKIHISHVNSVFMIFFWMEGILLKRQVRDAILFYKLVKRHRIKLFNDYMDRLPARTFVCGASR